MMPSELPDRGGQQPRRKDGCQTGRLVSEPTTAATLNLAACAAQASRLWASLDSSFSGRCLTAAKTAWQAALDHPSLLAGNVPGDGGGNYDDREVSDEFFWAAAELYATTADGEYLRFLKASPYWSGFPGLDAKKATAMSWSDTAALGTISLISAPSALDETDRGFLVSRILRTADRYVDDAAKIGYGAPLEVSGYVWGSNSCVLDNAIILAIAYDATKRPEYRDAVARAMDYLLGYNGLRKSFITGYGIDPPSTRTTGSGRTTRPRATQPLRRECSREARTRTSRTPRCDRRASRASRSPSATSTSSAPSRPTRSASTGTRRSPGSPTGSTPNTAGGRGRRSAGSAIP